ncbi:MAG TPA: bifunctional diaminohydroxyphosphoribosylaminopyrimidine deaminase/5-amino-6-(5-phosphoribosylamino)uracil reductase RibD [bacterium]|nr:bifunctional diaminohydroxyphosphoribosylaminopyrimidine deaminase/5-amino-6-(5-phosphoribosylamino)uracil reductase RibD [bacterium]
MAAKNEIQYMRRALELAAQRGRWVSPNPKVGAVLVKNGKIVGEGAHEVFGRAHAEINALKDAGARAKGATLYVTLEPCSHYGKTPPCAEAIIAAGVAKVVAATRDPNPLVRGRGFAMLKKAGLRVESGLLRDEAEALNPAFFFSQTQGRPWVLLKAAVSLDGKLATASGRSKWVTGEKARLKNHELRSRVDAILIGSRTALRDKPRLSVRLRGWNREDGWPLKVLLDSHLRVSPRSPLFRGGQRAVVFCSKAASPKAEQALRRAGAKVLRVGRRGRGLQLKEVLARLQQEGVRSLMVEGGAALHGSFLDQKLADGVALFIAPKFFGGDSLAWLGGKGFPDPNQAPRLEGAAWEPLGDDWFLTGKVRY